MMRCAEECYGNRMFLYQLDVRLGAGFRQVQGTLCYEPAKAVSNKYDFPSLLTLIRIICETFEIGIYCISL